MKLILTVVLLVCGCSQDMESTKPIKLNKDEDLIQDTTAEIENRDSYKKSTYKFDWINISSIEREWTSLYPDDKYGDWPCFGRGIRIIDSTWSVDIEWEDGTVSNENIQNFEVYKNHKEFHIHAAGKDNISIYAEIVDPEYLIVEWLIESEEKGNFKRRMIPLFDMFSPIFPLKFNDSDKQYFDSFSLILLKDSSYSFKYETQTGYFSDEVGQFRIKDFLLILEPNDLDIDRRFHFLDSIPEGKIYIESTTSLFFENKNYLIPIELNLDTNKNNPNK